MTDPVRSIVARADALMQKRRTGPNGEPTNGDDGIPVLTIDFDDVPTLTQVDTDDDDIPVLTLSLDEPDLPPAPTPPLAEFPPATAAVEDDASPPAWETAEEIAPATAEACADAPPLATEVLNEAPPAPATESSPNDAPGPDAGEDDWAREEIGEAVVPDQPAVDLEALSRELADQVRSRLLAELPTLVEAALQSTLRELTDTLKDGLRDTTDAALKDFIKSHIKPITAGQNRP